MGAHAFIMQHRWAKQVAAVVNLEALGSGGREFVFQCNSHRMISAYGKYAPFPFGSSAGDDIFKWVVSESAATDFRTFLKYGPKGASL